MITNKTNPETIILKGTYTRKEEATSEDIYPGTIVERGGTKGIRKQTTAKQDCSAFVVIENNMLGKEITDKYSANDNVSLAYLHPGSEAYLRVAAAASAIAKNDKLEVAGDGTVRKLTDGAIFGIALEAVNNSSGSGEAFIQVEIK